MAPGTAGFRQLSLGYAHRRARVFWFWWLGMTFALPGLAQAAALVALGQSPGNGLVLAALGVVISGAGWLAAIGPRFTRTDPRPADDVNRTERHVRIASGSALGMTALMLAIVAAFMFATPRGTSPEVLPVLAVLAVFPFPIAAATLYSAHLHRHRERLYADWLERR